MEFFNLNKNNYYQILGIPYKFIIDNKILKKNFEILVAVIHSLETVYSNDADSIKKLKENIKFIENAYHELSDPIKRAIYIVNTRNMKIDNLDKPSSSAAFRMSHMSISMSLEEAKANNNFFLFQELESKISNCIKDLEDDLSFNLDEPSVKIEVDLIADILYRFKYYIETLEVVKQLLMAHELYEDIDEED